MQRRKDPNCVGSCVSKTSIEYTASNTLSVLSPPLSQGNSVDLARNSPPRVKNSNLKTVNASSTPSYSYEAAIMYRKNYQYNLRTRRVLEAHLFSVSVLPTTPFALIVSPWEHWGRQRCVAVSSWFSSLY